MVLLFKLASIRDKTKIQPTYTIKNFILTTFYRMDINGRQNQAAANTGGLTCALNRIIVPATRLCVQTLIHVRNT